MQVLLPAALLLAALALVVLAFHIRRRRNVAVPSLVIWRQLQAGQVRRNRVWQWPNPSWSLLLQLVAVLAMVAALAQPLLDRGPQVDHWIYVLDQSGPMQAVGDGGTLFEEARAALDARFTAAAGAGRQSLLAVASDVKPVLIEQPIGRNGMSKALASLSPHDTPADWSALAEVVQPLLREGEASRLVVYSDRTVAVPGLPADVTAETVIFAAETGNAAISATLEQGEDDPDEWTLSGVVRLDPGQASTEVVVGFATEPDEQPLEWSRRTLGDPDAAPADEPVEKSFSVTLDLPGPGIVSATLVDDGNGFDNVVRFFIDATPKTLDILYVGAGDQPLLSALRAIDGTQVFQAPQLPADLDQYGLVVVDNSVVDRQPETNTLWIGTAGVGSPLVDVDGAQTPTFADGAHPLMRDVDWTAIEAETSVDLSAGPADGVLLAAGDQPLITTERTEFGRNIRLGFDPRLSSWPRQPSLPVFASNLVGWLGLAPHGLLHPGCEAGRPCRLDRRLEGGTVERLDGQTQPIAFNSATWTPAVAGLYEIVHGSLRERVAVNPVLATPGQVGETAAPTDFPLPVWPFLLALAAAALLAEAVVSGRGPERFLVADGLRKNNPLSTRRRLALVLHGAVLALMLAALFNAPLPWRQAGETLAQVVAPGGTALPGADLTLDAPSTLRASLERAFATLPWGVPGHVVVSGPSAIDEDAALALAGPMRQRDIVLDVEQLPPSNDAVSVASLHVPQPVFTGDTFQLVGIVRADQPQPATLRFEKDGEVLVEQDVALVAGDNRVETIITDIAAGETQFRLSVTANDTGEVANDTVTQSIGVRDAGAVAVIANDSKRATAFSRWLDSQGITGTLIEPDRVPYRPRDWARYDGAVLLDLPAIALTTLQQQQLENAVAEQGMGLLILGGPNSFGPGGYLETPLEDASPLSSRVPRDAPEATLVFVLDRSGSMQQPVGDGTRLDIAKQATLSAIELLNQNSQVGIIVFDSEPTTVLPLSRLAGPEPVAAALTSVDPGGGTSVYPGLEAAFEMLRDVDTPARHIIVMTDGLSQPGDFPGLLEQIRAAGITVSSVSIGEGAERGLIEEIARLGGGSFHATDDFAALPSILSQEAMLLSGSPIETGTTQPLWASRSEPFLRGLPPTMPPIDGFVLTTAKPAATLSMVAPDSKGEPMPLLASWRYGAGQVLALTTEAVGPWSSQWQALDSYPPLWAQAIRQFLPGVRKSDAVLDVYRQGDTLVADLSLRNAALETPPQMSVTGPDGQLVALALEPRGAGTYRAVHAADATGTYRFAATAGEATASAVFDLNYPFHLGDARPDTALRDLALISGGQLDVTTLQRRALPDRWTWIGAWPIWLSLALAVFMAELAVRYTRLFAPRPTPAEHRRAAVTPTAVRPPVGEPAHT